ncbi:MAG: class I SAM-dependent methyltransferase [Acetobacteraceae bacterium]|nr:class I SAM-dependent methyltransferase [Acetobacteraceae bacterium]
MSSVVWDRIRARPWLDEPPVDIGATVTMLHSEELRMLRWLVREHYTGAGHIMDLGCFLGGSTVALAQGLQASGKPGWIETFDLFQAEDYAGELYGGDQFRAGDRVRHIFDRNVAPYSRLVRVTDGDFLTAPLPDGPIEILFVDLAKWHTLNDRIVEELFPRLIPGRSVVIQQDYVWSCCAWIHVAMEKLKSSFSYLCHVESASVLFGLDRPISREEASAAKWSVMAPGERDAYSRPRSRPGAARSGP